MVGRPEDSKGNKEMSTFTPAELLELDAADLRGLLEIAEGDTHAARARHLGLDPHHPAHVAAVERAYGIESYSPPIGAAQTGVRSDLTPTEQAPDTPDDDQDQADGDPQTLSDVADFQRGMAESVRTGQPFFAGTFAMYGHPSGAVVLVTEDQCGEVRQRVIPRKAVKAGLGIMSGKGIGRLFGRG